MWSKITLHDHETANWVSKGRTIPHATHRYFEEGGCNTHPICLKTFGSFVLKFWRQVGFLCFAFIIYGFLISLLLRSFVGCVCVFSSSLVWKLLQKSHTTMTYEYHVTHRNDQSVNYALLFGFFDRFFKTARIFGFIECLVYFVTGVIALHSSVGLLHPSRKTFSGRVKHLKWLLW